MKNRFKTSILFTVVLVIASLVCTGSVLAKDSFRVEAQCYQFIADDQPSACDNPKSSIWVVESRGGHEAPCGDNVKVWADYGKDLTCQNFTKSDDNKITGQDFSVLDIIIGPDSKVKPEDKKKKLSDAKTTNSACDEMWLRFTDEKGCNLRCYKIGGSVYCM